MHLSCTTKLHTGVKKNKIGDCVREMSYHYLKKNPRACLIKACYENKKINNKWKRKDKIMNLKYQIKRIEDMTKRMNLLLASYNKQNGKI